MSQIPHSAVLPSGVVTVPGHRMVAARRFPSDHVPMAVARADSPYRRIAAAHPWPFHTDLVLGSGLTIEPIDQPR